MAGTWVLSAIVSDTGTVRRAWQSYPSSSRDTTFELQEFFLALVPDLQLARTKPYGEKHSAEDLRPTEGLNGVQEGRRDADAGAWQSHASRSGAEKHK